MRLVRTVLVRHGVGERCCWWAAMLGENRADVRKMSEVEKQFVVPPAP